MKTLAGWTASDNLSLILWNSSASVVSLLIIFHRFSLIFITAHVLFDDMPRDLLFQACRLVPVQCVWCWCWTYLAWQRSLYWQRIRHWLLSTPRLGCSFV